MKSFFYNYQLVICGFFAVVLAFIFLYGVMFYIPSNEPSKYAEIATSLNSPEFNSKLIEYYSDGKITLYENYRLEQLASEIKEEQFLSNLQKNIQWGLYEKKNTLHTITTLLCPDSSSTSTDFCTT